MVGMQLLNLARSLMEDIEVYDLYILILCVLVFNQHVCLYEGIGSHEPGVNRQL